MGAHDLAADDLARAAAAAPPGSAAARAAAARLAAARTAAAAGAPPLHYAALGVRPGASAGRVRRAYLSLAAAIHSDKAARALWAPPRQRSSSRS
jgi:DnaJ-class molecular chaperone